MRRIFTKAFWYDAAERTISSVAQALLTFWFGSSLPEDAPVHIDVDWTDWRSWLQVVATAAVLQMLKNIVAATSNPVTGASFGQAVPAAKVVAVEADDKAVEAGPAAPQRDGTPVMVMPVNQETGGL